MGFFNQVQGIDMSQTEKKLITAPYLIIRADGSVEERAVEWPREPGYALIEELITPLLDGGLLEHVNVWLTKDYQPSEHGRYTDMFVDEESAIKGLPLNEKATQIYRCNHLTHRPTADAESMPSIYGTAVLFDERVWF